VDDIKLCRGQKEGQNHSTIGYCLCVSYDTGYLDIFCFLQTPIIGPSRKVMLPISNNPLTCDCRDYDIIAKLRIFTRSRWLNGVYCNLPSQLFGKPVSYILCHSNSTGADPVLTTHAIKRTFGLGFCTLNFEACKFPARTEIRTITICRTVHYKEKENYYGE